MIDSEAQVILSQLRDEKLSQKLDSFNITRLENNTLILQNQESFKAESWYKALGMGDQPNLFKWWT